MPARTRIAVLLVILVSILGGLLVRFRSGPIVERAEAGAISVADPSSTTAPDTTRAHFPRAVHDPAKRDALRWRLLEAAAATEAETAQEQAAATAGGAAFARGARQTNDLEEFGRFLGQAIREDFLPMARACAKDLAARMPSSPVGTATVAFELLGDAKIGGVVNEAEVVDAGTPVGDDAFETCIRESLYGVYFDPPPAGGRATLNFSITLDGTGGVSGDVDDFHLKDRRGE